LESAVYLGKAPTGWGDLFRKNVVPKEIEDRQTTLRRVGPRRLVPLDRIVRFRVAGTALLLAVAGLYGVMAYSVARRTAELGTRIALGATPGNILRLVLKQGLVTSLTGVAIGIGGAMVLTRTLRSFLFGLSPTDPVTFAGVALLLILLALLACYLPARRAGKVDPMEALRCE
jgi:ABC-type lipoprotein release transport system permease subunit